MEYTLDEAMDFLLDENINNDDAQAFFESFSEEDQETLLELFDRIKGAYHNYKNWSANKQADKTAGLQNKALTQKYNTGLKNAQKEVGKKRELKKAFKAQGLSGKEAMSLAKTTRNAQLQQVKKEYEDTHKNDYLNRLSANNRTASEAKEANDKANADFRAGNKVLRRRDNIKATAANVIKTKNEQAAAAKKQEEEAAATKKQEEEAAKKQRYEENKAKGKATQLAVTANGNANQLRLERARHNRGLDAKAEAAKKQAETEAAKKQQAEEIKARKIQAFKDSHDGKTPAEALKAMRAKKQQTTTSAIPEDKYVDYKPDDIDESIQYSDYQFYQILENNGYVADEENLEILKEGIISGRFSFIIDE